MADRIRNAADKRLRRRRRRLQRRLLDDAYQAYFRELALPHNSHNDSHNGLYNGSSVNLLAAFNRASPSIRRVTFFSCSRTSSIPTCQYVSSKKTRLFSLCFNSKSASWYSPEHSFYISSILFSDPPRPTSPANSTTPSVKFIDEILIPPPRPRQYYHYDP